jgi:hypothetical protein
MIRMDTGARRKVNVSLGNLEHTVVVLYNPTATLSLNM